MKSIVTLWQMMRGDRARYTAAAGCMLLASGFYYLVPLVLRGAVDHLIDPAGRAGGGLFQRVTELSGGRDALAGRLWVVAAAVVFLHGLGGLFTYLRGRWSVLASESIVRRLRDRLFDHLQRLPASFFDSRQTGDLVQRCTSDVETLRLFLSQQVVEIFRAVILLAGGVAVMLYISPLMTVFAVALLPVIVVFATVFVFKVRRAFELSAQAEAGMTAVVQENLTGIRVVRAFARQDFERGKFAVANAEYRNRWYRLIALMAWYWGASDFMCMTQNAIVLTAGGWGILSGWLTIGDLLAFITVLNLFLWPVRMMGRILTESGKAVVAIDRLGEILDEPIEADGPAAAQGALPPRVSGQLDVEHLSFAFAGGADALRDVSFHVPAGSITAIIGPSGSGKSAFVHLLLRLYDYGHGQIRLDGWEIRDLPRRTVRRQVGVVLQEPFLYSRSVRDNIRLGNPRADDTRIQQAAEVAGLHDSIQSFHAGYDTLVGERGVTLSGGQRQRLALARAVLADPPVLVLDDAVSAVDTRTEAMILSALRRRRGRATTIVIAHRLSTLRHADQIIVLDAGRVVQQGDHKTLLDQDGLYSRLWEIQTSLETDLREELQDARRRAADE